ncbi:BON domain-containing protein [Chromobacterium violaceum]|uniref:BON domain-containing protein n=1 Tax=Chromobacterium violaceum TaxID=536 RepID=UPI001CE12C96|nr:BON domain-containing protein [Chromobacterium violaceum]
MRKALILASLIPALYAGASFAEQIQPASAPVAQQHAAASAADAELGRQVNQVLAKAAAQLGAKVEAQVNNGDVVLNGTAPNQDAISRIAEEVSRVHGVKSVRSQVNLQPAG